MVIWVIGLLYNWKFKESGLPGNMMVAPSVAWTFIFGGAIVGGLENGMIWVFGALAFVFDLGEEIAGEGRSIIRQLYLMVTFFVVAFLVIKAML